MPAASSALSACLIQMYDSLFSAGSWGRFRLLSRRTGMGRDQKLAFSMPRKLASGIPPSVHSTPTAMEPCSLNPSVTEPGRLLPIGPSPSVPVFPDVLTSIPSCTTSTSLKPIMRLRVHSRCPPSMDSALTFSWGDSMDLYQPFMPAASVPIAAPAEKRGDFAKCPTL